MTRILPLLVLIGLWSCSKDEKCDDPLSLNPGISTTCQYVDSSQHALYFKFTGTWCPPCGSDGAIKMRNTLQANEGLIGMEIHYNDEMKSAIGYKFISQFAINEFPSFILNNDENVEVEEALNRIPQVGIFHEYKVQGDQLVVTGTAKALWTLPGPEYFIAIYLLEDGYVAPQYANDHTAHPEWEYRNQRYPEYIHNRIFRDEASGNAFGRLLHSGIWLKDQTVEFSTSIDIPEDVKGEVYPVTVIWQKENRRYSFLNAVK